MASLPEAIRVSIDVGCHVHRVALGLTNGEVVDEFDVVHRTKGFAVGVPGSVIDDEGRGKRLVCEFANRARGFAEAGAAKREDDSEAGLLHQIHGERTNGRLEVFLR